MGAPERMDLSRHLRRQDVHERQVRKPGVTRRNASTLLLPRRLATLPACRSTRSAVDQEARCCRRRHDRNGTRSLPKFEKQIGAQPSGIVMTCSSHERRTTRSWVSAPIASTQCYRSLAISAASTVAELVRWTSPPCIIQVSVCISFRSARGSFQRSSFSQRPPTRSGHWRNSALVVHTRHG